MDHSPLVLGDIHTISHASVTDAHTQETDRIAEIDSNLRHHGVRGRGLRVMALSYDKNWILQSEQVWLVVARTLLSHSGFKSSNRIWL